MNVASSLPSYNYFIFFYLTLNTYRDVRTFDQLWSVCTQFLHDQIEAYPSVAYYRPVIGKALGKRTGGGGVWI